MNGLRNYSCDICSITCNSAEQLRMHEGGSLHLKKCANSGIDTPFKRSICYQPLQASPEFDSDSENLQICPMCFNQYSQADFFTHKCERDLLASTSLLPGPFVVIDQNSPPKPRKKRLPSEGCDFYCDLCDLSLGSMASYDAHVDGVNCIGLESLSCSLSDIKVVEGSDSSLVGCSLLNQSENAFSPTYTSPVSNTPSVYCNVCDVHLNSTTQMASHVSGRKHQSKLLRSSESVSPTSLVTDFFGGRCWWWQRCPKSLRPDNSKVVDSISKAPKLPPNSVMCHVCSVPVSSTELSHHEQGRAHIYKATMNLCARINDEIASENRTFKRSFDTTLPSLLSQLPPFPTTIKDHLTMIAEKIEDVVLKISFNDMCSISAMALAIAKAIVSRNYPDFEHNFAVWICPQTSIVSDRIMEVRKLIQHFSVNKPLLANIQKHAFGLDNAQLELTKHDIAFSTPGAFTNLLMAHSNIHRAIPVLVFTDVERCVDNDPMHDLLTRFAALAHRPRVGSASSSLFSNPPSIFLFSDHLHNKRQCAELASVKHLLDLFTGPGVFATLIIFSQINARIALICALFSTPPVFLRCFQSSLANWCGGV
ncbi:unnamed protein product [Rodentolepis nana]|uniref:C2H2-type domain-containing protein n=1 Tax=Rodentolepis nana TaxID=102285 RepID=A0A0R3TP47_RODNA|nr:unnamed protein product [Rodentolepis nana]